MIRGQQECSGSLFSYVSIEDRIPASHPLRRIIKLADQALDRLNPTLCRPYAAEGRPSVPPERLLNEEVMGRFLEKLIGAPEVRALLSDEHFSVDGTLLQAWASHASLERIDGDEDPPPPPSAPGEGFGQPKDGKKRAKGDFRGIKLSNETHRSGTDPDALMCRKSKAHQALPTHLIKRGGTSEIWRSEPLNQRNPARRESNQIARARNAALLTVFPQTPKGRFPESVAFAHIDMNNADAEVPVLKKILQSLNSRVVAILDDCGWWRYSAQKRALDPIISENELSILESPARHMLAIKTANGLTWFMNSKI